jgi:hypothetical protein
MPPAHAQAHAHANSYTAQDYYRNLSCSILAAFLVAFLMERWGRQWSHDADSWEGGRQEWQENRRWEENEGDRSRGWSVRNNQGDRSREWRWGNNQGDGSGGSDEWQNWAGWQDWSSDQQAWDHDAIQPSESAVLEEAIVPQSRPEATFDIGNYMNSYMTPIQQPLDSFLHGELLRQYEASEEYQGAVADVHDAERLGGTAVAEFQFDCAYFQNFRDFTDGYKQHNIALKWFRELGERQGAEYIIMDNSRPMQVPLCDHPKGMLWQFDETRSTDWRWQEMVAQLDLQSMRHVVEGSQAVGPQRCLIGCQLVRTDKYDHKRHHALGNDETYYIWDFVLLRGDGSKIALHPNFSDTKITSYEGDAPRNHELPASGKGGTSGPGTYKYFKNKGNQRTLRFDARKRP